jgi:uncharacterized membrane protein
MAMEEIPTNRSIAEVLGDIVDHTQQIIRAEVRLAKAELREELEKARRGAVVLVVGAVMSVLALGVLLLAGVYALASVVPPWMAALIVGVVTAVVGVALVVSGLKAMSHVRLSTPKTVDSVQETVQWAKTRAR